MRYLLIIFLSFLLTIPISIQSKSDDVLYGWKTFDELQWMNFGNGKPQPKYKGEIKNGKMNGLGVLTYPYGEKVVGSWKEGKEWNTEYFSKDGEVIGKYINGEKILGVLFHRRNIKGNKRSELKWYEYGDDQKYMKYIGEIKNGKPNGQGIFYYNKTDKFEGQWKDGEYHGQGTLTRFGSTNTFKIIVGEFREGEEWITKHYDEDQIITQEVVNGINFDVTIFGDRDENERSLTKHYWRVIFQDASLMLMNDGSEDSSEFTWSEKLRYVGEYVEGKPNGQGTLFFDDGTRWEGQWIGGKEWKTKHFSENGTIIGKFSNGKYFIE